MGSAYSGTTDLLAVHEKIARDDGTSADNDAQFRLLLLLHSIDLKLMQSSVQHLSKSVLPRRCRAADAVQGGAAEHGGRARRAAAACRLCWD